MSAGGDVRRLRQEARGDHLRAEWGGGGPRVLLLGHFDTVWQVGQLERMPVRRADGRLLWPGVFDMKAGIGVAMLAVRALHAVAAAPLPTHRDAVDDRRGNRQRHVARGDRRRGAGERRGAGARAVAAGRRREDEPEGRRGVRAGGARRVRPRRRRSRQRRERDPRDGPPDSRDRSAAGPAARHQRQRRRRRGRLPAERGGGLRVARRSTCGCRRWRTPRGSMRRCADCARRSPARVWS